MNCLIDLTAIPSDSPATSGLLSALDACIAHHKAQGFDVSFIVRADATLQPSSALRHVRERHAGLQTHWLDVTDLAPGIAAQSLSDFLENRQVGLLLSLVDDPWLVQALTLIQSPGFCYHLWSAPEAVPELVAPLSVGAEKPASTTRDRPHLAIVSPYPPQKSGVADYVAQLVPALSPHYECVLVIPDELDDASYQSFPGPVVRANQFRASPELHERVLYQIGNSPGHLYALPLLESIPGVVTLHDFYLGDALHYAEEIRREPDALLLRLLQSHGLNVLPKLASEGLAACARAYPCNLDILRSADSLVVHAHHVLDLAKTWYAQVPHHHFHRVPFPKAVRPVQSPVDKAARRAELGISETAFVVSTFGFGVPTKRHDILVQAWIESRFARDPDALLLIVGEYPDEKYQRAMQDLAESNACNVRFTGFVDEPTYWSYLDITDLAVQLRVDSRGETSAAVMDCLASRVPVIANDHGSLTELPDTLIWKIADPPQVGQLLTALEHLYARPDVRQRLADSAFTYLQQHHTLEQAAGVYRQVIEQSRLDSAGARERALVDAYRQKSLTENGSRRLAETIVYNRQAFGKKQLLIDISEVATHDLRTGIQRVVRSILAEFLLNPPPGFEICPVFLDRQQVYRHARQFMLHQYGLECAGYGDERVNVRAGDHYLGIDLHPTATADAAHIYQQWRARGVRTSFVLYDLLPVQHPAWFPPIVLPEFTRWLHTIATHGDQIIAISQTVANDMQAWLNQQQIPPARQPVVGWFHLGADIRASLPTGGLPDDATSVLSRIGASPSFLMVATVEPRKGHAQALDAFEQLWAGGVDANLVIVGKQGWMVNELADRMNTHPALGERLFWLQGISDEYLEAVYPQCAALLAASEGEGFGLPIIEAAQHQLPVIARDIPVFREVGGDGVSYFHADQPGQLADHLRGWLNTPVAARPIVGSIRWQTWRDSAAQIDSLLRS